MNIRFLGIATAGFLLAGTHAATAQDLISHWKLDETSGDTVVNEVGPDGTNINGVGLGAAGVAGTAYEFDGLTKYIDANHNPIPPLDDFSAFLWMNSDVGNRILMGVHHGQAGRWALQISSSNLLMFFRDSMAHTFSETEITDGQWHHVGVTRAGDTITLWVDGAAETMNDNYGGIALADPDHDLLFGGRLSGESLAARYDGLLDDVQIYNAPLSANQVQFLMNNPGAVVPEPAAIGVLAIGVLAGLTRRR